MRPFLKPEGVPTYIARKGQKDIVPRESRIVDQLEERDDFVKMATRIADLIKEYGTMPTPRQIKIHLSISARQMREACGDVRADPYELLLKEAKRILQKRDGLRIGFGRLEPVEEDDDAPM